MDINDPSVLLACILGRILEKASDLQYPPAIAAVYDIISAVRSNLDIVARKHCDDLLSLVDSLLSSSKTAETMSILSPYQLSKLRSLQLLLLELQQTLAPHHSPPARDGTPCEDDIPVVQPRMSRRKHNALLDHCVLSHVRQNMFDSATVTVFRPFLTRDSLCIFDRLQALGETGVTKPQVMHRLGNMFAKRRVRYFKIECAPMCPFCKTDAPQAAAPVVMPKRDKAYEQTEQLRKTRGFGNGGVQLLLTTTTAAAAAAASNDTQPCSAVMNAWCFGGVEDAMAADVATTQQQLYNTDLVSSVPLPLQLVLPPMERPRFGELALGIAAADILLMESIPGAEHEIIQWHNAEQQDDTEQQNGAEQEYFIQQQFLQWHPDDEQQFQQDLGAEQPNADDQELFRFDSVEQQDMQWGPL
eukprot:TRINITY_DN3218_c0_g2_i1.p1 TRINITY_DN3218_c0_g2~~TRINITY_DN3218_c0_g2_i1.p1  ORF type:complete len:415 (+),score=84.29 TRINITY_DN3218_c0_g2_i1:59-1303(+)